MGYSTLGHKESDTTEQLTHLESYRPGFKPCLQTLTICGILSPLLNRCGVRAALPTSWGCCEN